MRAAWREATEAGLSGRDVITLLQSIVHEEGDRKHVRKRS